MTHVKIYQLQDSGEQEVVTVFKLDNDGVVVGEGDDILIENLRDGGIKDHGNPDGPKLYFKDGLKFLEQLKFNFTSGYLNASEVMQ